MFYKKRIEELENKIKELEYTVNIFFNGLWKLENPSEFKEGDEVDIYCIEEFIGKGILVMKFTSKFNGSYGWCYEVFCNQELKTIYPVGHYHIKKIKTNGKKKDH